jgi:hypothetical protein
MKWYSKFLILGMLTALAGTCHAYPLNGYPHTGILRLEGLLLSQEGKISGPKRVSGALLDLSQVDIRLPALPEIKIPETDHKFSDRIQALLGEDADEYAVALLDLTNPQKPRYASIKGSKRANPGSVGKLAVALAVFQALADIYPDNIEKRINILQSTMIQADEFIQYDHHKVPFWDRKRKVLRYRAIRRKDKANLWSYLDWMMSASSNAAAAMVQKQLLLMVQFGRDYPVTEETAQSFFENTPKKKLTELSAKSHQEPLIRNGLDLEGFRQGSFFTWQGKNKVPGTTSHASPDELIKFLLKLEKGELVDTFSSREIKRLLYMTGKRIRYVSAPALDSSAVYFKSGSLYKCKPEPEFKCEKYKGNVLNQLATTAIIEQTAKKPELHYIVAIISNILYKNSAVAHQTLATRIHRLLEKDYKKKWGNFK